MSTYRLVPYLPGEALLALYRRRGPVFNTGVGRHGYTYLLGAEANKFVFANADAFSWRETFENLALVDGPTALIVSDGDDHRRRRSIVAPGLRHRQIQDYVQTMVSDRLPAGALDPRSPDYRKPAPHEFIPFSGGL